MTYPPCKNLVPLHLLGLVLPCRLTLQMTLGKRRFSHTLSLYFYLEHRNLSCSYHGNCRLHALYTRSVAFILPHLKNPVTIRCHRGNWVKHCLRWIKNTLHDCWRRKPFLLEHFSLQHLSLHYCLPGLSPSWQSFLLPAGHLNQIVQLSLSKKLIYCLNRFVIKNWRKKVFSFAFL